MTRAPRSVTSSEDRCCVEVEREDLDLRNNRSKGV